jgi:hypothetical protein
MILSANGWFLRVHHQKTASRFIDVDRSLKIAERGWDKPGYDICTDEEYEAIVVGEEGKHRLMLTRGPWRDSLHGRTMDQTSMHMFISSHRRLRWTRKGAHEQERSTMDQSLDKLLCTIL